MGAVVLAVDNQPEEVIGTKGYSGRTPSLAQVKNFKMGDHHKFHQLYDQVVSILRSNHFLDENERLFDWSSLQRLQKARNDAQHGAKAPHPSDLPELVAIAKEFIDILLKSMWQKTLVEVSLASLIEDETLQKFIQQAELLLADDLVQPSVLLIYLAFLLGRLKRRYDWWKGRNGYTVIDDYDNAKQISNAWGMRDLKDRETRLMYDVVIQVRRLPKIYDNWVLGLDYFERNKLKDLTPRLTRYPKEIKESPPSDEVSAIRFIDKLISGESDWSDVEFPKILSKEEVLWVVDFTTEALLRWQREQRGGYVPVDKKYGKVADLIKKAKQD